MELFWIALLLPRATGADARTAQIVTPDHSCRSASFVILSELLASLRHRKSCILPRERLSQLLLQL
ncbi:MAG TPA: hypothetical protein DDX19_11865 [Rhodopirellula baltica]|nr:hypothetical protein [Rhodopirellula baltica]